VEGRMGWTVGEVTIKRTGGDGELIRKEETKDGG